MPDPALDILQFALLAAAVICLVYWGAVLAHLLIAKRTLPTGRDGIEIADRSPPTQSVCVIVPAHNEAANIATLIQSLKAQDYDRLKVVLALDRCTDDTKSVAQDAIGTDHRFEIVEIDHCPDDWAGKVHAAHCGVTRSKNAPGSDVYIFTDADTRFDPSCVRATVALAYDRGLDLLSLHSTLDANTWFERLVQPAASFELVRQFPLSKVNRTDDRRRSFANGQFMLFKAAPYHEIGGHANVKRAILEDIMLAVLVKWEGKRGGLLMSNTIMRCRMYASWPEFVRGWKRIYTETAWCDVKRLRRYAWRAVAINVLLPLGALACLTLGLALGDTPTRIGTVAVAVPALLMWGLTVSLVYKESHARLVDIPGFVIGSVLVWRIMRAAARDIETGTPTKWGGMSYTRKAASPKREDHAPASDPNHTSGATA